FLAEVLYLEDLALALTNQVSQRTNVGVLERVHRTNRELEIFDRRAQQIGQTMRVATRQIGARDERRGRMRAEAGEVLEVRLRQRRGVAHCFFRSDGAVRLDSQRQPVVVGSLSNTR